MTEIKDTESELQLFRLRLSAAVVLVIFCFSILLFRFIWLQALQNNEYEALAESNRISIVPAVPSRGLIFDRNGKVLASNFSAYTLEIFPSKIKNEINIIIEELSKILKISEEDKKRFFRLQKESKLLSSLPIRTRLTDEEVAKFIVNRYKFPGVDIKARLFRQYPQGEIGSHMIGYIGRINKKEARRIDLSSEAANYRGTDYIGKEGIEKSYEKELHGETGYDEIEISAGGRAVRLLSKTPPSPGKNLTLTVDIELQKIIEQAFGERRGALVAIEPSSGEILAYVSKPTFNLNLFAEGINTKNWNELNTSIDRPLLNRPLIGSYPPGSTFKPFMALAALELDKRTKDFSIEDPGYFWFGDKKFRDDKEDGHGEVDMYKSIVLSCNTYYYMLGNDINIDLIHDFMKPFGFGQLTGIDLENEIRGILPSTKWKKNYYKRPERKKWYPGETISVAIGQGYNSFTPLQLAHAISNLSNNGIVMKPHLVKSIENSNGERTIYSVEDKSYTIPLKKENVDFIKSAMIDVNKKGTASNAFKNAPYVSGGKTGTAQAASLSEEIEYEAEKIAERLRDHSLYIGFAPAENPKIALAVIVENSGYGAAAAAPIARIAMDYHLIGKKPKIKEKKIFNDVQNSIQLNGNTISSPIISPLPNETISEQDEDF